MQQHLLPASVPMLLSARTAFRRSQSS